jgi:hypothetical protein
MKKKMEMRESYANNPAYADLDFEALSMDAISAAERTTASLRPSEEPSLFSAGRQVPSESSTLMGQDLKSATLPSGNLNTKPGSSITYPSVPIDSKDAIVAASSTGISPSGSKCEVSGFQAPSTNTENLPSESRVNAPSDLRLENTAIGVSPSNTTISHFGGWVNNRRLFGIVGAYHRVAEDMAAVARKSAQDAR